MNHLSWFDSLLIYETNLEIILINPFAFAAVDFLIQEKRTENGLKVWYKVYNNLQLGLWWETHQPTIYLISFC